MCSFNLVIYQLQQIHWVTLNKIPRIILILCRNYYVRQILQSHSKEQKRPPRKKRENLFDRNLFRSFAQFISRTFKKHDVSLLRSSNDNTFSRGMFNWDPRDFYSNTFFVYFPNGHLKVTYWQPVCSSENCMLSAMQYMTSLI